MGFYILPETKRQDFDVILHITKDKIAGFWYDSAYYLRQGSRILWDLHITTNKTVGFWWESTYNHKEDSMILMDSTYYRTKQYDFDGILHITTDKTVAFW